MGSQNGFHFGTQGKAGEAQSKSPALSRGRYNYHSFLYSMSGKDAFHYKQHQRRFRPEPQPSVPPRTSSLPVLDSSSSDHEPTTKSSESHSVAIMRAPLPADLRLGGKHSGYDFSSWIESTIDELQRPGNYENLRRRSQNLSTAEVPWMQEDQDPTFSGLRPRQYSEMPVYADPLSAIVSHPYSEGCGEASFHSLSKSADLESVKAPEPLFSKPRSEHSPRCSDSTLVDGSDKLSNAGSGDDFGMQRTTSSGSNKSHHSIKGQEEMTSEAAWMKPLPSVPVIGSIISPTVFSPTQSEACPSMPCAPGLLLDAFKAGHSFKTSFKMPSVVGVASVCVGQSHSASHSRNVSGASFVSAVSSLDFPMLEPLMMHDLARTANPVSSVHTPLEPRAMGERRKPRRSMISPSAVPTSTTPVSSTADLISPLWGLSDHSLAQNRSMSRSSSIHWKLTSMSISGILADIISSIAEFPAKMLCLDTPCIVAIRHDMHADRTIKNACTSAASSPVSPISPSSAYARRNAGPKVQKSASVLRKGFVRGRPAGHIGDMLRAPLPLPASLRAGSPAPAPPPPAPPHTRSTSSESTITLLSPDRHSPTMDLFSYYRNDLNRDLSLPHHDQQVVFEGLKCPDLSAIASIFPESDGWWHSCLLAHLLAYNYLQPFNSALPSPLPSIRGRGHTVPDKAARTMGISNTAVIGKAETRYSKVLVDLEKCMVRIMKIMIGKREGVLGFNMPRSVLGKGELAPVQALSVIVRGMDF